MFCDVAADDFELTNMLVKEIVIRRILQNEKWVYRAPTIEVAAIGYICIIKNLSVCCEM